MGLKREFQQQGNWLFRWRSYLPIVFLPLIALSLVGSHYPFESYSFHIYWEYICLTISFLGLIIRAVTIGHTPVGTSGRNTEQQKADSLNTTGIYSTMRHPLYLGNYLIALGAVLVPFVWWLPVIYTLTFWVYYERIMFAEEEFLREKFGADFSQWAAFTPAFLPRLSQWTKPLLRFSWRNVLKREYTAMMLLILLHTGIEFVEHLLIDHQIVYETFWVVFFFTGLLAYAVLRMLKRHSQVLHVVGR